MRILIAEDDHTSRTVLAGVLKKNGHEVVVTVNGAEAWQILQQPNAPRLVILDWMMPEMDGLQVLKLTRALETDLPPYIIMLTSKGEKADVIAGLDAGANDYLAKPFNAAELRARTEVGRRMVEIEDALSESREMERKLGAERLEQEQLRRQEQFRAINQGKLASLGEIATGIAHEINQPLTFINTLLYTTIERFTKNTFDIAKLTAKFEMAIHQAARITTIIDHLRTFGRADEKKLSSVGLEAVLDNALILMQERIRLKNIVILRKIEKNLPSIMGNSHSLEQIFINFFQNSLDAMQEQGGGKIMISMGHDQSRDEIWLSFADSGPGMTAEVQAKMFEPFFTTKDIGHGTGLGLSVVFGIVSDHHGQIVCHSEAGKGATFLISLPRQVGVKA